jgi:hypothetical protein
MEVEVHGMGQLDEATVLSLLTRAASGDYGVVIRPTSPTPVISPHYRGRMHPGWNLTSVALLLSGEPPARPGSAMWAEG